MCRMIGSVRTLTQHFLTLNIAPSDYKPKRCPRCGVAGLWAHGVYHRKGDRSIISDNRSVSTPIPRFRCPHCNTTCSRLPGCLSPRRWYPWDTQAMALFLVFRSNTLALVRELVVACEDTIRRWRAWLAKRTETFEFHLRGVFAVVLQICCYRYGPIAYWMPNPWMMCLWDDCQHSEAVKKSPGRSEALEAIHEGTRRSTKKK